MGNCNSQNYGVPMGGSLEFSRAIEQRFQKLGGTIHYGKRVEKILVENNKAVGVRLSDGTEPRSDIVISDLSAIRRFLAYSTANTLMIKLRLNMPSLRMR